MSEPNPQIPTPPARRKRWFKMSPMTKLRAYFLAGILITAPVSLTIYIAWNFVAWIDAKVLPLLPPAYNPENYLPFSIPGIGLIIGILMLTAIGALTAGLLGKWTRQIFDAILNRLPVIRSLYGAIKQIVETVLANQSKAFRECVLVEFPRRGIWALGFVSGTTPEELREKLGRELVNVFVPTTPNPTGGYLLFVPREEVIFLAMPADEGLKLVVSTGIVAPNGKAAPKPILNPTAKS